MTDHDVILRDTIARHFPEARTSEDGIALGFGDLAMTCWVHATHDMVGIQSAALYFTLSGGRLGGPVFASVSGYGETSENAIIEGGCQWACSFGPVLRAAFGGEPLDADNVFDVTRDGQTYRVFIGSFDRAMALAKDVDTKARMTAARARFAPRRWLTREVLESGVLPLLHAERPTVISTFVSDAAFERVVEVKVDGCDWPHTSAVFADVPRETDGAIPLMRELAVVVPVGAPPALSRGSIERTLDGLMISTTTRNAAEWHGWQEHCGALSAPLSAAALAQVEATLGELPADYRAFLADVAASGAGPGYGLLPPIGALHEALAKGTFTLEHESDASDAPHGALPLAHAGCGVMWLLVLQGPHRGEVWVDARSSDRRVRRVAPSFTTWYRDWLGAAVRNSDAFLQWDSLSCATAHAMVQVIESLEAEGVARDFLPEVLARRIGPAALVLTSTGNFYFPDGHTLNPCEGCVRLVRRWGLDTSVFATGDEDLD